MADVKILSFTIDQCQVNNVTIYKDRAEVNRLIPFIPSIGGDYSVKILNLTNLCDSDSIRVALPTTNSNNTDINISKIYNIVEVIHNEEFVTIVKNDITEINNTSNKNESEMQSKIQDGLKEIKLLKKKIQRINQQQNMLGDFTNSALNPKAKGKEESANLLHAKEILNFFEAEVDILDEKELEFQQEISRIEEEIELNKFQLNKYKEILKVPQINDRKLMKTVNIILQIDELPSQQDSNILIPQLQLSYVVYNASWSPSYDLRIRNQSVSQNVAGCSVDLSYYAEITQHSGEDWNDCMITLSTSNPAIGSSPPPLPTKVVDYLSSYKYYPSVHNSSAASYDDDLAERTSLCLFDGEDAVENVNNSNINNRRINEKVELNGSGDAGSCTFTIKRKASIASDNKPHKVTIATEQLSTLMVHYVSPSLTPAVYVQAKIKNTSLFPLLPSEKVFIFIDGNFISNSSLKQTNPGESFYIYLGVDPSVKVEYMPCKITNRIKGWLSGSEVKKYDYRTVVINTKKTAIRIIIADILPRSVNNEIVVELLEPQSSSLLKASDSVIFPSEDAIGTLDSIADNAADESSHENNWPKDFITQNKQNNNIIWFKTVAPSEKIAVNFSYRIVWPKKGSKQIQIS